MSVQAHERQCPSHITVFWGVGTVLLVNVLTTKPNLIIPKTRDLSSIHLSFATSEKRKEKKKDLQHPQHKNCGEANFVPSIHLQCPNARIRHGKHSDIANHIRDSEPERQPLIGCTGMAMI